MVLPVSPEQLAQLGALAHEVSELRQKALTALAFGLLTQAGDFAGDAQVRAAELLALCARLVGQVPSPPAAPALRRVA